MFYCDDCRRRWNWPESMGKSWGKCETCGATATCNDVPSRFLPVPPDEPAIVPDDPRDFGGTGD